MSVSHYIRVINVPDDRKEFWKENIGILRNPVIRKFVLREDIKLEKKAGISALWEEKPYDHKL